MTSDSPAIVLVGGAPGSGKTALARGLAARLGEPTQTFDHVMAGIRAVTTVETHPAFHAGRSGHVEYFTEHEPRALTADALALEEACWPAIERICALCRAENAGLVMDWWLLSARRLASAAAPGIDAVWIEIEPDALEARERANNWFFSASTDPGRMFEHFMARSRWANRRYPAEARELGYPVLEQPGARPTDDLVDEAVTLLAAR